MASLSDFKVTTGDTPRSDSVDSSGAPPKPSPPAPTNQQQWAVSSNDDYAKVEKRPSPATSKKPKGRLNLLYPKI